jgi:hypothetical protein
MGSFNTSFVFLHTREAKDVSAYDLYIYAKGLLIAVDSIISSLEYQLPPVSSQLSENEFRCLFRGVKDD